MSFSIGKFVFWLLLLFFNNNQIIEILHNMDRYNNNYNTNYNTNQPQKSVRFPLSSHCRLIRSKTDFQHIKALSKSKSNLKYWLNYSVLLSQVNLSLGCCIKILKAKCLGYGYAFAHKLNVCWTMTYYESRTPWKSHSHSHLDSWWNSGFR